MMRTSHSTETVEIIVDRERVRVAAGITVAAALLNHGTWGFRRGVHGELRGPMCGMGVCFECRVNVDGAPHQRACLITVVPEMQVRTERDR